MASSGLIQYLNKSQPPPIPEETSDPPKWKEVEYKVIPCVGCGYCCHKRPCELGYQRSGGAEHCPYPTYHDGRWWCSLIEQAEPIEQEELKLLLHIGAGCCCSLFNQDRQHIPTPTEWEHRRNPKRGHRG